MRQAHDVLGVRHGAPLSEVRAAYRRYVVRHHPDHGGDPGAFVAGQDAYRQLMERTATGDASSVQFHRRRNVVRSLRRAMVITRHRVVHRPVPPPRVQ